VSSFEYEGLNLTLSLSKQSLADPSPEPTRRPLRIALAGYGVVGCLGPGAGGVPKAESILSDLRLLLPSETQADEKALAC
jgi:hypothetical protein